MIGKGKKQKEEVLNNWRKYQVLRAVRENRIYSIDGDILNRPGPRAIDVLEELAKFFQAKR